MADFFDDLRRKRAASGDVAEILGNLVGIVGGAVGQKEHDGVRRVFRSRHERADVIRAVTGSRQAQGARGHFLCSGVLNSLEFSRTYAQSAFTFSTGVS